MLDAIISLLGKCACSQKDNVEDIENKIKDIKADIKMIKENHLFHIERDMNEMKMDIKILLSKIQQK